MVLWMIRFSTEAHLCFSRRQLLHSLHSVLFVSREGKFVGVECTVSSATA